jgi:hypothetical protein
VLLGFNSLGGSRGESIYNVPLDLSIDRKRLMIVIYGSDMVKYFDRDFKARFLGKYPAEDSYTFVSDEDRAKEIEFNDQKLILNIFAENKPNLATVPVWSAKLHALWDLDEARFNKVDFKPGRISVRKPQD